jgi:Flp pilus assembly pilin Flp
LLRYQWLLNCSRLRAGRSPKLAEGIVEELLMAFLRDDHGQDLIEYTLLLAFVCLATAALFISSGGSLSAIWVTANSQLTTANAASAS